MNAQAFPLIFFEPGQTAVGVDQSRQTGNQTACPQSAMKVKKLKMITDDAESSELA